MLQLFLIFDGIWLVIVMPFISNIILLAGRKGTFVIFSCWIIHVLQVDRNIYLIVIPMEVVLLCILLLSLDGHVHVVVYDI